LQFDLPALKQEGKTLLCAKRPFWAVPHSARMGDTEFLQAQGNVLDGDSDVDGDSDAGGGDDYATALAVSIPVPFGLIMQNLQTCFASGFAWKIGKLSGRKTSAQTGILVVRHSHVL
jgi:hypothetical protein